MDRGEGARLWFDGVDLTTAPYYTYLTDKSKYWFLNFTSEQIAVGPLSLISTNSTIPEWVLTLELRIEPPDLSRATMLAALTALANLLDPTKGECPLVFGEFPNSFFMAKAQGTSPSEEGHSYMTIIVEFACTGPSYSKVESVTTTTVTTSIDEYTVISNGDSKCSPRHRVTARASYTGDISLENLTTGEKILWNGTLGVNDVLDFILDPEYGTPYSCLKNGQSSMATVVGPAWPHLNPGSNLMLYNGPTSGTVETRWRDRWLVGQHYPGQEVTQIILTANVGTPYIGEPVTFNVYLTSEGAPISRTITIFHFLNRVRYDDHTISTDANGHAVLTQTFTVPGNRAYFAEFRGDEQFFASVSSAIAIDISVQTRVTLTTSKKVAAINEQVTFSGVLQWYDTRTNTWQTGSVVAGQKVTIWHRFGETVYTDATATAAADGTFSLQQVFNSSGRRDYYAEMLGGSGYGHSISPVVNQDIDYYTKIVIDAVSDWTPAIGQTITITGHLFLLDRTTETWRAVGAGHSVRVGHSLAGAWYNDTTAVTNQYGGLTFQQSFNSDGLRVYHFIHDVPTPSDQLQYCDSGAISIVVGG